MFPHPHTIPLSPFLHRGQENPGLFGTTPARSMKRRDSRKTGENTSYADFWITSLQVDRTKLSGDFRAGDGTTIHQTLGSKRYMVKETSQLGQNRRQCGKAANVVCGGLWHARNTMYLPARWKREQILTETRPPHSFVTRILERNRVR